MKYSSAVNRLLANARIAIALVFGLGTTPALAAVYSCPPEIKVNVTASNATGFEAMDYREEEAEESAGKLSYVWLFAGKPDMQAPYRPTNESAKEEKWSWNLKPEPKGYWMMCRYLGETMTYIRQIDAAAKSCHTKVDSKTQAIIGVDCI